MTGVEGREKNLEGGMNTCYKRSDASDTKTHVN